MKVVKEIAYVETSPGVMEPERAADRPAPMPDPFAGHWDLIGIALITAPIAIIALCESLFR
jgi:hypothetical protein